MNRRRQTIPKHLRFTIEDFNNRFPDDAACLAALMDLRFPGGISHCAKCGVDRKHYRIAGRPVFSCAHCGTQVSPMAGTIFEHSSTSLRLWFYAMYLLSSTRCGISAKQLQRETGVTYKTAWRMFRQIRSLLGEEPKLSGKIEMDETWFGGQRKFGNSGPRGTKAGGNKKTIAGAVERGGQVVARHLPDRGGAGLLGMVKEYVMPESTVFTDEYAGYDGIKYMPGMKLRHRRIKHNARVYVRGDIHTNSIEGFWSLVKRGIGGVYHSVGSSYLQSYLDEYTFRFNRRDKGNLIFNDVFGRVSELATERNDSKGRQTLPA